MFFSDDDEQLYLDLLSEPCRKAGVEIWSYRLMPNHVHMILTPSTPQGLGLALGESRRRYSGVINARLRVTGDGRAIRFVSPQFPDGRARRTSRTFEDRTEHFGNGLQIARLFGDLVKCHGNPVARNPETRAGRMSLRQLTGNSTSSRATL